MKAIRRYFGDLTRLAREPRCFFEAVHGRTSREKGLDSGAVFFARATGALFAVVFFLQELLLGGRVSWIVLLVAVLGLLALPFVTEAAVSVTAWVLAQSLSLLGESPDKKVVRLTACYASAGILPMATGLPVVPWLSLSTLVFLAIGFEKGLKCSRFKAAVLAGFPSALLLTVLMLSAFIFKIKVF